MSLVSQVGIDLVKAFEGFRADAYLCPAGVWTIGYGSTKGVKKGQTISLADAETLIATELQEHWEQAASSVKVALNQHQVDAVASFVFNLGVGAFRGSTLLRYINEGRSNAEIEEQIRRWRYASVKGVRTELAGLVTRRNAEAALWSAPADATVRVSGQQIVISAPAPAPPQPQAPQTPEAQAPTPPAPPQPPPAPQTTPAPEKPIQPGEMPQRPTTNAGKPAATSPSIWSGIVALFAGLAAMLSQLLDGVRQTWATWTTQLGFNPIWILLGVFVVAMLIVIIARINDRKKLVE